MPDDTKIRTAVIGAGKMGSIHAKVYNQLPESELVAIVDTDGAKAEQLAETHTCGAYTDCRDVLDKVDAVTISTPTITHLQIAKIFLRRKIPVLIEKPLAANAREGKKIVAWAHKHDTVVAVGHSERCNPVAQAMKRLSIEPKFIEAHRVSPYPFRSTDIGVVLDIMIHDIDIILSLAASKIRRIDAVGVSVIEGAEDICNARIVFENGCIANITASRLALKTERKIRIISEDAYVSADFVKRAGTVVRKTANEQQLADVRERLRAGEDLSSINYLELVQVDELEVGEDEPLKLQVDDFLSAVRTGRRPEVDARAGFAAVRTAERIVAAAREAGARMV